MPLELLRSGEKVATPARARVLGVLGILRPASREGGIWRAPGCPLNCRARAWGWPHARARVFWGSLGFIGSAGRGGGIWRAPGCPWNCRARAWGWPHPRVRVFWGPIAATVRGLRCDWSAQIVLKLSLPIAGRLPEFCHQPDRADLGPSVVVRGHLVVDRFLTFPGMRPRSPSVRPRRGLPRRCGRHRRGDRQALPLPPPFFPLSEYLSYLAAVGAVRFFLVLCTPAGGLQPLPPLPLPLFPPAAYFFYLAAVGARRFHLVLFASTGGRPSRPRRLQ